MEASRLYVLRINQGLLYIVYEMCSINKAALPFLSGLWSGTVSLLASFGTRLHSHYYFMWFIHNECTTMSKRSTVLLASLKSVKKKKQCDGNQHTRPTALSVIWLFLILQYFVWKSLPLKSILQDNREIICPLYDICHNCSLYIYIYEYVCIYLFISNDCFRKHTCFNMQMAEGCCVPLHTRSARFHQTGHYWWSRWLPKFLRPIYFWQPALGHIVCYFKALL